VVSLFLGFAQAFLLVYSYELDDEVHLLDAAATHSTEESH
jgi:hypothetical protein